MNSLIFITCLALISCTPIEREVVEEGIEEVVEYEREAYAPPFPQRGIDDRTAAIPLKPIDTNPATVYKGRKTSKTLYRPDTRGHQATATLFGLCATK